MPRRTALPNIDSLVTSARTVSALHSNYGDEFAKENPFPGIL